MRYDKPFRAVVLSASVLAGSFAVVSAEPADSSGLAQATGGTAVRQSPAAAQAPAKPGAPAGRPAPVWRGLRASHFSPRAEMYYAGVWGVGELRVKAAESGGLIRFNYRVLDPEKAAALNDKKAEPALYDAEAGVKLMVPQMDKIGKLRQSSTPKEGMTYWMAFSNPTRVVKPGHHVDVVIGQFRANNLVVE